MWSSWILDPSPTGMFGVSRENWKYSDASTSHSDVQQVLVPVSKSVHSGAASLQAGKSALVSMR